MTDLKALAEQYTRYRQNFFAFCKEVLGYGDLIDQHQELCDFLQHDAHNAKLVMMPRYSFKSSVATVAYTLWRLTCDDSLRILIYSDASNRSEAFLTEIKNHLLGMKPNSKFRDLYGSWEVDPKRGVWNQGAIVVKPRGTAHAEPSVDTAGLESSKVGAHYDLILFDDMVTRENCTTKELMEKVYEVYKAARSLLKPGGEIVMVGTRWHFGDMYGRLLAENETTDQFGVFLRDAEVSPTGDPYPFAKIGLDKTFLDEQRKSQGTRLYSALYRLNPQDDETSVFKAKDFAFYGLMTTQQKKQLARDFFITCCVDPAISQASGADETAITVCGTDTDMNLYLLDVVAGHLLPDQLVDQIFSLHQVWNFHTLGIETIAFQRMLMKDIQHRYEQEKRETPNFRLFHIEQFTGNSKISKEMRIQALQPYHERGALKFPGTKLELLDGVYKSLAFQMLQFPLAPHDDILDSLAYHVPIHRKGSVQPVITEIPYSSAAWFEREQRKKEVVELARTPRWQRKPLLPLAFS